MMDNMLCYSTGSLPEASIEQILDWLEPSCFRGLELVITPKMLSLGAKDSIWQSWEEKIGERGFTLRNVHCGHPHLLSETPHYPGMAEASSADREKRIDGLSRCMDIAKKLGTPRVTVTTGLRSGEESLNAQEERMRQSLEVLQGRRPPSINLGIEQEPEHVIFRADQLVELCEQYHGLGANYDLGHAAVIGEDIREALAALQPYLYNLHFEDISGRVHRHLLFGEGEIPFEDIFQWLKNLNYQGDMTPDLYPFTGVHQKALEASQAFFATYLGDLK